MTPTEFSASLNADAPPIDLELPAQALWWDAKGNWTRAHDLVNDLETCDAMAVHAYLHRKEGSDWNAEYWYRRAGRNFRRAELHEEWRALVDYLVR